ncbi:MAG: class I SAM-dependent methyltransferase [bacterium]|nr:class I SAM-dependent methyltransferase [bacterium]
MSKNFQTYSKYYNLLYGDKDYNAEANYVSKKIRTFAPKAESVLEFGSGTGGHGLLLQKNGFQVFGLDKSEYMAAEAKKKGLECQVADISNFKLKGKYDAVVSLFHVISYLTDNKDLIATFFNAHKHLNNGGVFLFDVWYSPAVYKQKASHRVKRMKNKEIAVTRTATPKIDGNRNVINVEYKILVKDLITKKTNRLLENHPMRHFSIPEIGLLAKLTGFEMVKAEEFLTGKKPSDNTWGVCFVLKKI